MNDTGAKGEEGEKRNILTRVDLVESLYESHNAALLFGDPLLTVTGVNQKRQKKTRQPAGAPGLFMFDTSHALYTLLYTRRRARFTG